MGAVIMPRMPVEPWPKKKPPQEGDTGAQDSHEKDSAEVTRKKPADPEDNAVSDV